MKPSRAPEQRPRMPEPRERPGSQALRGTSGAPGVRQLAASGAAKPRSSGTRLGPRDASDRVTIATRHIAVPTRPSPGSHWDRGWSDWDREWSHWDREWREWDQATGRLQSRLRHVGPFQQATGRQGRQVAGASRTTGGRLASPTRPRPFGESPPRGPTRPRLAPAGADSPARHYRVRRHFLCGPFLDGFTHYTTRMLRNSATPGSHIYLPSLTITIHPDAPPPPRASERAAETNAATRAWPTLSHWWPPSTTPTLGTSRSWRP